MLAPGQTWYNHSICRRNIAAYCSRRVKPGSCSLPLPLPQQQRRSSISKEDLLLHELFIGGHLQQAIALLFDLPSPPSIHTYIAFLKACGTCRSLPFANQVHSHIRAHSVNLTGLLGHHLVRTLAKCGAVGDAVVLLRSLPFRSVVSWTAIISAYADAGYGAEALEMYACMQEDDLHPDTCTFVSLLKACGSIPNLEHGRKLHAEARTRGCAFETRVGNTLVSMYGKCGDLKEAEVVFSDLLLRDTVSWNALLSAYVEQGEGHRALQLYRQMQHEGANPDARTLTLVLRACSTLAKGENVGCQVRGLIKEQCLEIGRTLHAAARKRAMLHSPFIAKSLVNVYSKCGMIQEAQSLLSTLSRPDVVTWTAVLSACVEYGQGERALQIFRKMQEEGITPDQVAYIMSIQACTTIVEMAEILTVDERAMALDIGKAVHADACRDGLAFCLNVSNALLKFYGKCRAVLEAEEVFTFLNQPDIVSCGAMLSAYVEDGRGDEALCLYRQMKNYHLTLNDAVYVCVLQACCLMGSLETCTHVYFELVSNEVDTDPSVSATLIHAYRGCAMMTSGEELFEALPQPDSVLWTSCITGHAEEGNSFDSLAVFEMLSMAIGKPDNVAFASALSACNYSGLVDEALEIFLSMKRDFNITANAKHYGILVDLLGRAGNFEKVENILGQMPMQVNSTIWLGLLGSCNKHANSELAEVAFKNASGLQPKEMTAFILMSNIYAEVGTSG
ncbi:hypothetical protein GOP47_0012035 [Adiantum capillus-veneris]|uniref:Pentatricopeptide repeat-containing protein n=1 Tax=Adiantum capillus-veneris TaxID=13818 RepID=A0A9D4UV44_ADICA|nr:hypothetical protein GOP47_0012035 [Adiantum capillus-veneris]